VVCVGAKLLILEPELDLLFSRLNSVRSVADVSADVDAEVTTDSARVGVSGLSCAKHLSAGSDNIITFPNHGANGARAHVLDEASEETLLREISVMLFHVFFAWGADLHRNELEALLLEALDDLANEATLDTIGLNHNEGALLLFDEETFYVDFGVSSGLNILNRLSIVVELTFDAENVSELLNTGLSVLAVAHGMAVLLLMFGV